MSKRLLPQSIESERAVLGLMATDHSCLIEGIKKLKHEKYFHKNSHRIIFKALYSLYAKDKKPSLMMLEEELKLQDSFDKIGPSSVTEIIEASIGVNDFKDVLGVVVDKFNKRNLITVSRDLNKLAYNDSVEGDEFVKQAKNTFSSSLEASTESIKVVSPGDIWKTRREELVGQSGNKTIAIGFENLDNLVTGGWMRKQVSVTAGRPGMGKSSFKSNLLLSLCLRGKRCVSFAPEQGFNVEQARLESLMTDIPLVEILESYKWRKKDYRVPKIVEANKRMDKEFNYHIIPSRGLESKDVRPVLYEISQKYGPIDYVTVDLFDKFTDVNTTDNTVNAIAVGLQNMAQYAEEFDCHINLLVQISRKAEEKGDKRPKIRHLKNSGAYEEVARLIILMYREKYYHKESLNNDVEVEVAKQSNGPIGTVFFDFDEDLLKFIPKDESLGVL